LAPFGGHLQVIVVIVIIIIIIIIVKLITGQFVCGVEWSGVDSPLNVIGLMKHKEYQIPTAKL
jgi:hypothetical protein